MILALLSVGRLTPRGRRLRASGLLALALAGLALGVARASCPNPEGAIASPVADRFRTYLQTHFEPLDDPSLARFDRLVLIGYALGRQAPAVGDDPMRRDAFDCLLVALEQRTYWTTLIQGELGTPGDRSGFRTIFAAAMGFYDERVAELTGYREGTVLPTVFDPPFAPVGVAEPSPAGPADPAARPSPDPESEPAPVAIVPEEIGAYRDDRRAAGLGPDHGPGGATCPLDQPADFLFVDTSYGSTMPCRALDGALWCCSGYYWSAVAFTDGDGWAMAPLDGGPVCTFTTTWRGRGDGGEPTFGGGVTCPGREGVSGWYVLVLDEDARE